jgi:hypothetical protein
MSAGPRGLLLVVLLTCGLAAQPTTRQATNLAALKAYPSFYHLKSVLIAGDLAVRDTGAIELSNDGGTMLVVFKGSVPNGAADLRGELWDVGRMRSDDPRLAAIDVARTLQIDANKPWPQPGQVLVFAASSITAGTPPSAPSVRHVVLSPGRYLDQSITLIGQFSGRNILGHLPEGPNKSRWDFVLRTGDAAVWVTNLRPKGKDFDLALDTRIDTGRWLEVTGTLRQGHGLQWIDGQGGTIKLTRPSQEAPSDEGPTVPTLGPAPEVVFSAPTAGEIDVPSGTKIRIQVSRDLDPASIKGRVEAVYVDGGLPGGAVLPPPPAFTTQYNAIARVIEIRFAAPLVRFRSVRVSLLDGVVGTDKQPLRPWTLEFQTGP